MGVKKVRVMMTNDDKSKEQVYPITHIEAVDGLAEALSDGEIKIGVKSINGQTGDVIIPALIESEYSRIMNMLTAYENGDIGSNSGDNNITVEKVGEIE